MGRAVAERPGRSRGRLTRRALVAAAALPLVAGAVLAGPLTASATSTSVWSGGGANAQWNNAKNWSTTVPTNGSPLDFPNLGVVCEGSGTPGTCYKSVNNISGLTIPGVTIDGSSTYSLSGDGINLGANGLTNNGPTTSVFSDTAISMPLNLTAGQTWSLSGQSGQVLNVNKGVTSSDNLEVDLTGTSDHGGPQLDLRGTNDVSSATVAGLNGASFGLNATNNGSVLVRGGGTLNDNGDPVIVTNAGIGGDGTIGPITASGANLLVGTNNQSPGALAVTDVTLENGSVASFTVGQGVAGGGTPGTDYSQLTSTGLVDPNGAQLNVVFGAAGFNCVMPSNGDTYTLVSTTGTLVNQFTDANGATIPNGGTVPVTTASTCPADTTQRLQIQYNTTAATKTVTATVVGPTVPTTTTVGASPNPAVAGTFVTFTAHVSPSAATGTVRFTTGSNVLCTATVAANGNPAGVASCQASNAPVGVDVITGTYSGDATYIGSTGVGTLDVTAPSGATIATSTSGSADPNSVLWGKPVAYSVSVHALTGTAAPGGNVTVSVGSTTLCNISLLPVSSPAATSAGSCVATNAPVGSDALIFEYGGNLNFVGSGTSIPLNVKVANKGYWLAASDGGVFAFPPGAPFYGSAGNLHLNKPVVGMAATPDGGGYWLVAADGGIFKYGNAKFFGSTGNIHLNEAVVGMAATPDGGGYWLVAADGGIFAFGDAGFYGSAGNLHLNSPVVGMASTPDGHGYWLAAADGGIFSYGDAKFQGSAGNIHLNSPVVGMSATNDGGGYWLVASDGGVFKYGDATFWGSAGNLHLNKPVVGMAATTDGKGYWLVASDGGIFKYGPSASFFGSTGNIHLNSPAVAIAGD